MFKLVSKRCDASVEGLMSSYFLGELSSKFSSSYGHCHWTDKKTMTAFITFFEPNYHDFKYAQGRRNGYCYAIIDSEVSAWRI